MGLLIEDYALIGDTETAALVGIDGSIDWCCLPRFDSPACFAALLGHAGHGRWLLAPVVREGEAPVTATRRYRGDTLVLETTFTTATGVVRVIDAMTPREETPDIVRIVEGVEGEVAIRSELVIRFGYGAIVPWVRRVDGALVAVAGPDGLCLRTPAKVRGEGMGSVAEWVIRPGERVPFVLTWFASHRPIPGPVDADNAIVETEGWWHEWVAGGCVEGPYTDVVTRSLIILKALTFEPTGGILAAVTTSLPEDLGGSRNWDYRFCWLRDASLTLRALMNAGHVDEATAWRDWLLRAVAGDPSQLQVLYGPAGERRVEEIELPWLPGYEESAPVRVGNGAAGQLQLDVYGEVIDALYQARNLPGSGSESTAARNPEDDDAGMTDTMAWGLVVALLDFLGKHWQDADEGIWEIRGPRRCFTHSRVMSWVAFDRAVRWATETGLDGPTAVWKAHADVIHAEVCAQGWHEGRGSFVQSYDSDRLDASLLLLPLVGFLPADDPRVVATVDTINRELCDGGFLRRYTPDREVEGAAVAATDDGSSGREGSFLACSFWLVECLALIGRVEDATSLFERLLLVANDVGMLTEEYDAARGRQVGNVPQAFSHLALVNAALALRSGGSPVRR